MPALDAHGDLVECGHGVTISRASWWPRNNWRLSGTSIPCRKTRPKTRFVGYREVRCVSSESLAVAAVFKHVPPRRKALQLSFTTGPMFKRWEVLRTCPTCARSYMVGFSCHTCGFADRARRVREASDGRCITPGCTSPAWRGYCGPDHQRAQAVELRDYLLSALHTSEALAPGHRSASYAPSLERIEQILGRDELS